MIVLHTRYSPAPASDVEHGQGAIERSELEHCPLSATEWFIRVESPADVDGWQRRLNESVEAGAGCFEVRKATDEELRKISSGVCVFQK